MASTWFVNQAEWICLLKWLSCLLVLWAHVCLIRGQKMMNFGYRDSFWVKEQKYTRAHLKWTRHWVYPFPWSIHIWWFEVHNYLSSFWALSFAPWILFLFDSAIWLILSSWQFCEPISLPMSMAMFRRLPIMVDTPTMFSSISSSRASLVILKKTNIERIWSIGRVLESYLAI